MSLADVKKAMTKKKPGFTRQETHKKKRLAKNWRRPKGIQSKMRLNVKGKKPSVSVGYKTPVLLRGKTLDGKEIIHIYNVLDLSKLNEKSVGVIGKSVGKKKRISILEEAEKKKITLLGKASVLETIKQELKERVQLRKTLIDNRNKKESVVKEEKKKETKEVKAQEKSAEEPKNQEEKKEASKTEKKNTDEEKKKELREHEKELIKKGAQ